MSVEQSWGADTVALSRNMGGEESRIETRRKRASRPTLPPLGPRALIPGVLALVVAVALIAASGGGTTLRPAAIRAAANPRPQTLAKLPIQTHRRPPRRISKADAPGREAVRLENRRQPNASTTTQELATPELVELPPKAKSTPAPPPVTGPTSPSAEFGM